MEKYKIGEVARMLGLPNDTLRYYESRGIVTPQKDEESGYRYYDAWDLNYLLDSKWYRSYDFPLTDVVQMINGDNLETFTARCLKRENELLHIIYDYQQKLNSLALFCQRVSNLKSELGRFRTVHSPALVYQRQRVKYSFICDEEALALMKKWTDLMPFVNHTFIVPKYSSGEEKFDEYCWGYSLSPEDSIHYKIDIVPPVEYIPPLKSIHTVFSAGGRGTFMQSLKSQVIDKVLEMGHTITHPPIGHLIVRTHEDNKLVRFFEVWIPIE